MTTTTTSQITNETNYTTNSNNVIYASNSELFSELLKDKTEPKDISFEQYQELTDEDIERLYGINNDKSKEANKLQNAAQFTDDQMLNEVLFENTLKDISTDGDFRKFLLLAMLDANPIDTQAQINHTFDPDNLENILTPKQLQEPFYQEILSKKDGYIPPKPTYDDHIDIRNSEQLINYFRNFKEHFDEKIDKPDVTFHFDKNKLFQTIDNIINSYDNKLKDNNALLASYTANNNSTKSKIEQTQQENETKQTTTTDDADTKELTKAEKQESREKLLADIDSLLRTGLTVSELERLKEMLAEIRKLESKKSNDADAIKELNEMLDKLEKAIADLQKRLHTITTEHEKDDKKIEKEQNSQNSKEASSSSESKTPIEKRIEKVEAMVNDLTTLSKKTATGESLLVDELLEDK